MSCANSVIYLSRLGNGNLLLLMAGTSDPQCLSVGNAQDAQTGPEASMLSAICSKAWIVTGHADNLSGES